MRRFELNANATRADACPSPVFLFIQRSHGTMHKCIPLLKHSVPRMQIINNTSTVKLPLIRLWRVKCKCAVLQTSQWITITALLGDSTTAVFMLTVQKPFPHQHFVKQGIHSYYNYHVLLRNDEVRQQRAFWHFVMKVVIITWGGRGGGGGGMPCFVQRCCSDICLEAWREGQEEKRRIFRLET